MNKEPQEVNGAGSPRIGRTNRYESSRNRGQEIHILLVDDNEGDILLTLEALTEARIINKISVARDGAEGTKVPQSGAAPSGTASDPILILLDINLPRMDGTEVLAIIENGDPALRRVPVIMLTTSSAGKGYTGLLR